MRIISKFQDYYDSGLAYGTDPDLVYVRHTTDITRRPDTSNGNTRDYKMHFVWPSSRQFHYGAGKNGWEYERQKGFLSFCGRRYFGLKIVATEKTKPGIHRLPRVEVSWAWSPAEADKWSSVSKRYWAGGHEAFTEEESWDAHPDDWANRKYGAPAVYECIDGRNDYRAVINPCLKDLGFQQRVDPFTAFQEISMYLAGPLRGWEDPDLTPEPTGAQKMAQKGMDPRFGFRHRPDTEGK